ncbi:enoyl-CoA hydratase/isomerase family protein [Thalassiella azotivora]
MEQLTGLCEAAGLGLHVGRRRWDVVLARPERLNAQVPATWRALAQVGDAVAEHRPDVVVLRALGSSFSAGLDRAMLTGQVPGEQGLAALAARPTEEVDRVIAGYQAAFTWWREVDALTVAAVQGHAIGAGFQLALACDVRVVADDVQLAMRETSLGLVPDLAGTHPLVEAVGYSVAVELCATGRAVDAQEAVQRGLAGSAVPADRLGEAVDGLVAAVLAAPPGAVADTKALLRGCAGRSAVDQRAAERAAQTGRLRAMAAAAGASAPARV